MNKVYVTPKESSKANLDVDSRILKQSPFMNKVYVTPSKASAANLNKEKEY